MAARGGRTTDCTPQVRAGRLAKAEQFMAAAGTIEQLADDASDIADAYVTLCVHAGIAAADVICCARLGEHPSGDDHVAAVRLLERADQASAKPLADLLRMKTKAGYGAVGINSHDYKRAGRAAHQLVDTARRLR